MRKVLSKDGTPIAFDQSGEPVNCFIQWRQILTII
jgi:hypothetical protein